MGCGTFSFGQEVGNQPVTETSSEGEDDFLGIVESPGDEEAPRQGDEGVPSPITPDARGEVGQTWKRYSLI